MRRIQSWWRTTIAIAVCSTFAVVAPAPASAVPADMTGAIGQVVPAVARIDTTINYQHAIGAGTGLVLDPGGVVLTNFHVVQGADSIRRNGRWTVVSGRSGRLRPRARRRHPSTAGRRRTPSGTVGRLIAARRRATPSWHSGTPADRTAHSPRRPAKWSVSGAPSRPRTN